MKNQVVEGQGWKQGDQLEAGAITWWGVAGGLAWDGCSRAGVKWSAASNVMSSRWRV